MSGRGWTCLDMAGHGWTWLDMAGHGTTTGEAEYYTAGAGCIMYNTYFLYNTYNTVLCIVHQRTHLAVNCLYQ